MAQVHSLEDKQIEVRHGEPVQIDVQGAGATGYRWHVEADSDRVRVVDHRILPNTKSFGGGGRESFVLEPLVEGQMDVTFKLAAPWEEEPAEVHVIHLKCVGHE